MSSTIQTLIDDFSAREQDEALLADAMWRSPRGGFISIRGYTNGEGEVAHHLINGTVSYENALARSLAQVEGLTAEALAETCPAAGGDVALAQRALDEVRASWSKSLDKIRSGGDVDSGYDYIAPGLARREGEDALYVWGLAVDKQVVVPVEYRPVNSKPLTLVKRAVERGTPVARFRRFKLEPGRFESVAAAGLVIRGQQAQVVGE